MRYMGQKFIRRSYNFAPDLLAEWEKFHLPSTKDFSASAGAGFFIYMLLPSDIREKARVLACDPDQVKARKEFVEYLRARDKERQAQEAVAAALAAAAEQKQTKGPRPAR
jgi:hypothetical protein